MTTDRGDPQSSDSTQASVRHLESRLRELRRLVRSSLALRAGALLLAALAGLVLFSLIVDRFFRLPMAGRIVAQSIYGAALLALTWKLFLRPVTRRLPDRMLADLIERRFPKLLDRFRSALEFSKDPKLRDPESADEIQTILKRRVIEDAAADARALRTDEVIDTPGVVSAMTGSIAVVLCVAVIGALSSHAFALWFRRNVLFEDIDWPYRTTLTVEGFEAPNFERGVPRGDPLKLRVNAEGELPSRVRIRLQYTRERLSANLAREGDRLFIHEHAEVTEPFTFVVDGGDFRSQTHSVRVLERPEVKELRVTLDFPAYTKKPPQTLAGDLGELAVPEGTALRIEGRATKALKRAWLEVEGLTVELGVQGESAVEFSGSYSPRTGGVATVHLDDQEGVPPNQLLRFIVTPVPDRIPTVLSTTEGIGSMITPMARIPLKVRANDDYGVTSLGIEYSLPASATAPDKTPAAAVKGVDALPALKELGPMVEESPAWEIGPLQIEPERRLDIRVFAKDNDGLHGSKPGFASTQSFLVVTPQRLGEEFLRREEEQRRLLERVVNDERLVRDSVYRLIDQAWKAEGALSELVVKDMAGLTRTERQLARTVTGVSGAMRLIRDEMLNNRLGETEEIERLVSAIIEPLTDLSERGLPEAAGKIGEIREMQKPQDRLQGGLTLANNLETILTRLESVLASMRRLEGFTEIVNRLRAVIKVHEESTVEARKAYDREVKSIFEDPDPKTSPPPPEGSGSKPEGAGNGSR